LCSNAVSAHLIPGFALLPITDANGLVPMLPACQQWQSRLQIVRDYQDTLQDWRPALGCEVVIKS
jgi:hypothetical protein